MTRSLYVMPIAGDGSKASPREPKYRATFGLATDWSMWDYGDEPWSLVGITDPTPAIDAALVANGDVIKLPDDLDTTVATTNERNTVRTKLEAVDIPGTWVQTGDSYREIVQFVGGVCRFAQVFQGISGIPAERWFAGGRSLDSTIGDLPTRPRQQLIAAADQLGFDRSTITLATTLRVALKSMGDQFVAGYVDGDPLLTLALEGPL